MKKLIGILFGILIIGIFTSCNSENVDEIAYQKCKESLIDEFPEYVSKNTNLVVYFYNNIWHGQTIVPNAKRNDFMKYTEWINDEIGYMDAALSVPKELFDYKYVKLNNNCEKILDYGEFSCDVDIDKYSITSAEDAEAIAKAVCEQQFTYDSNLYKGCSKIISDNNYELILRYEKENGYEFVSQIAIRRSDGLILFLNDSAHTNVAMMD